MQGLLQADCGRYCPCSPPRAAREEALRVEMVQAMVSDDTGAKVALSELPRDSGTYMHLYLCVHICACIKVPLRD